ncbi:MAG: phosphatase PAP2 family protein [Clostridia bacterium]|nr:phosphatase PAP2 family protein [Clostridia bacterium]
MQWLQSWIGTVGVGIASAFTMLGEDLICVAIVGFLYWCWDKELGKHVGLNLLFAVTMCGMVKNIVLRRRPYFDNDGINCLKAVDNKADIYDISAQGYSFPSIHATKAVTMYTSLGLHTKKTIWMVVLGILLPLLIGLSRIALGVHYPTDVIAGLLIGVLLIFLVPFLKNKIKNRWVFYAILVLVTVPGWFFCKSTDYYTGFGFLTGFILAMEFEARFVKFETTRNVLRWILRLLIGIGLYFVFNTLLKLPFSGDFLDSGTTLAYAVRAMRYFVITFIIIGVYPLLFRLGDKIFKKKS